MSRLVTATIANIQQAAMPSMSHPVVPVPLADGWTMQTVTTTAFNTTSTTPKTAMVSCQTVMEWLRMVAGHLQWRILLVSWWRWSTIPFVEALWLATRWTVCCHTSHITRPEGLVSWCGWQKTLGFFICKACWLDEALELTCLQKHVWDSEVSPAGGAVSTQLSKWEIERFSKPCVT